MKSAILLIYTGGTIGMVQDSKNGSLIPFDFKHLYQHIPELEKFDLQIDVNAFEHPIDSSDMAPPQWVKIVEIIEHNYENYDGFVILHGSDTMAYTASALSFMLDNLSKPVILTGSQLPIGVIRTDGKENLITAIEIASAKENNKPLVPEVAIYFEYKLYRGNRTTKFNAEHFDAFKTPNYPVLAEAGIRIQYNFPFIKSGGSGPLIVHKNIETNIAVLKLYPGISKDYAQSVLNNKAIKAVVMETFGSGNGPTEKWFADLLQSSINDGKIIINVTQCTKGSVIQGRYQTSEHFKKLGIVSGFDITFEAALTKLMYLFGLSSNPDRIKEMLNQSLRGEITLNE